MLAAVPVMFSYHHLDLVDTGLGYVAKNLRRLSIVGCPHLTEAALTTIRPMEKLLRLDMSSLPVSPEIFLRVAK